ncbi:retrovirus-related pol polyprotein from transposon TNT 1-94 [Tanacetum coccineum]|uniref:Retrovirus-related pol polyprotein from transposon TNT 1-94 n=1 Tax=Tanacetum coccineum TaxID=301880 RepID=A0ABQ5JEF7_9ASTR
MLEKDMYDSWKTRMELYMLNRQNGQMILESVESGPLIWPSIVENGVTRPKKYSELSATEALQADCDIKATNIILQGLPPEVYALVSNHKVAKELWERIQLLMQGTSLTKQERECKLYDEFDKFAYKKGESLREFYLRFSLLLNDMNIYNMKLEQFQVNTKFLNTLPPEWSKFMTDVKLVRDLHTTNIDQLHAYLGQHEFHANEVRLMHERNSDPLALVATHQMTQSPYQTHQNSYQNTQFQPQVSSYQNTQVQNVFYQMEQAVEQHRVESKTFKVKMNQALNENERLLEQVMSKDIVNLIVNSSMDFASMNVHECEKCLKLETELQKDFVEKEIYDKLFKRFTTLEKHCISLEVDTQLNQENFQMDNSISNQSAPSFDQLFELNELKAQSQEKDMDLEEFETINIELDHRVTKLIAENEHLKQTYKQLYDSIKPARVRSKEQCADLTNQVNLKSVEISDLNACLQEKVLVITTLKDELRKLKGKDLANNEVTHHPSDPEINTEPITPKLLNKRSAHSAYIKHTQEEAAVLRDLVDHIKANYPLDPTLESACKYTKLIQELLSKISKTCPSINNSGEQLVAVTPMNKVKRVRFTEPVTSSRNTITKKASTSNLASNKPMLSSTGVKPSTSASGSQPSGNTKKDKILQTQSSTQMNKVEAHPRKVKSSLKNKDHVVAPKGTAHVQHSKLNANSELKCVKCNGCMLSDNHDLCVLDYINNVNARAKSKSAKKQTKRKVWKPTRKMFTTIRYIWRPTSRTFIIVRNVCPLTRITTTTEAPLRKPVVLDNETSKPAVIQIVLWYFGTVKFGNDHVAKILGYGDYQIGNVTILRVYYVEGLRHNLFSVGQFCDLNLEVAFRQHTCFIRNLEGVYLLTGSQGNNLYTLSLGNMMASSLISRHGVVRGLPKLKFEKDHLCSACAMGKSKKKPHKPKSKDTNQEKLYLLYMDLCGPMRVASVNGKKYIIVIVDDYLRFTWVKFLRSKDEAPDFIIKFLKMIQLRLKVPVRRIKTDNGTEFVNQTLREYYEKVGISHETFVARSPQQNGVVERRNRTLIEAARTMLIYAKALLFLGAEAVATACYTQNPSIIRLRHGKTPYEILHDKLPDLSFFHVFEINYRSREFTNL